MMMMVAPVLLMMKTRQAFMSMGALDLVSMGAEGAVPHHGGSAKAMGALWLSITTALLGASRKANLSHGTRSHPVPGALLVLVFAV